MTYGDYLVGHGGVFPLVGYLDGVLAHRARTTTKNTPRGTSMEPDNLHLTEYHVTQEVNGGIPQPPRLWPLDEEAHVEDYLSDLVGEGYIIGTHGLGEQFDIDVARPSVENAYTDDEVRHWIVEVG